LQTSRNKHVKRGEQSCYEQQLRQQHEMNSLMTKRNTWNQASPLSLSLLSLVLPHVSDPLFMCLTSDRTRNSNQSAGHSLTGIFPLILEDRMGCRW
jgi:hypothetical protein